MPIYDFECPKCKQEEEVIMSFGNYDAMRDKQPCSSCGHIMKRIMKGAFRYVGWAKSRNLWDKSDVTSDNAGDRDAFEAYKQMEARGELTPKFMSQQGDAVKESLSHKREFTSMTK